MLVRNSDSMPSTWPTESEPLVSPKNLILTSWFNWFLSIIKLEIHWPSRSNSVPTWPVQRKASQVWPCLPLLPHSIHPGLLVAPSSFAPLLTWSLILDLPHLPGQKVQLTYSFSHKALPSTLSCLPTVLSRVHHYFHRRTCVTTPDTLVQLIYLSPLQACKLPENGSKVLIIFAFPGTRMVPGVKGYLIDGSVSEWTREDL